MKNDALINAIRKLVEYGIPPCEAFLICDDFIRRFGERDLDACIRSVEASYVA